MDLFNKINFMYTFNNFCYGINTSVNPELNNFISDSDLVYKNKINGIQYEVSSPYHGGKCLGDVYSVIMGTIITQDDDPEYTNEVRTADENDYREHFKKFIEEYLVELDLISEEWNGWNGNGEYDDGIVMIEELKEFIKNAIPGFYIVELSS